MPDFPTKQFSLQFMCVEEKLTQVFNSLELLELLNLTYSQTCLQRLLKGPKKVVFIDRWSLNTGKLKWELHFWDHLMRV